MGTVQWYSDSSKLFEVKGLIPTKLRDKWIRMVGFRNLLVHEYVDIDRRIVHRVLQEDLQDLEELKRVFAGFL